MKTLLNPWFLASCLLWLLIFITRRLSAPLPYLNSYLTDMLAVPVIGNLGLWFQRKMIIGSNYYVLSHWHVLFVIALLTLWFEVVLPHYTDTYTADVLDVILYTIGGYFFYKVMNKPAI